MEDYLGERVGCSSQLVRRLADGLEPFCESLRLHFVVQERHEGHGRQRPLAPRLVTSERLGFLELHAVLMALAIVSRIRAPSCPSLLNPIVKWGIRICR